jgi:hypothetical protein
MKGYVLGIFDTHAGHKLGLLNPSTKTLQEGPNGGLTWEPVTLNRYQEYLWDEIYLPALKEVERITEGSTMIVIHGGDLLHGNRFPEQTVTTSEYNQVMMATNNFKPILDIPSCKTLRIAAGTGAHDFTEHSGTLLTCQMLKQLYPEKDIAANYQGEADILGYFVDFSHHGPGEGIRIYLNGNNVRFYLTDLMIRCLANDMRPPDLVLRGHVHGDQDETFHMGNYSSRILVLPSMCGMSFHGRKVTKSRFLVPNGFALFEITDGKLTHTWKFIRNNDVRTKEKLL